MSSFNRRKVLRGVLNGSAVTVALPLLNCFLNGNGDALADGRPMPIRFGTWRWGLGINKLVFTPKKIGASYEVTEEMESLKNLREHFNLFTDYVAYRDGAQTFCHFTGWVIARTGMTPMSDTDVAGETFDVTIANQIGRTTRFKTLTASANGSARDSFSYNNPKAPNPADYSPIAFYTRLFGPDFQDPNTPNFTPDPKVMVRRSALSGVIDEIKDVNGTIGAEDKARLDQYFTGLRHLEQQFDQRLTKPEPIAACHPTAAIKEDPQPGNETSLVAARHKMLTDLMVMAVACDQTRVFNMSCGGQGVTKLGYEKPHHTCTHEEAVDQTLGYQPNCSWFVRRSMELWAYYIEAFTKVKEGAGTLLDNVLIYADTDHGYARMHSLDDMPMFTAGRAGGRVKTGLHLSGGGKELMSHLALTAMRVMGLEQQSWGAKSNNTTKEVSEILV